jgi:dTDP-4-dehydrorhamnose 3,5-epimerase
VKSISAAEMHGVKVIESHAASDSRGTFIKMQPHLEFQDELYSFATSINPKVGTIRGLHFQLAPYAEEKIITCIQGSIFDVIVDIRPESKTFAKFAAFELNAKNGAQIYLPKGIAHGFQTLHPNTIIQYCLSSSYSPESAFSINPIGELDINWPLDEFSISEKDASGLPFSVAAAKYASSLES